MTTGAETPAREPGALPGRWPVLIAVALAVAFLVVGGRLMLVEADSSHCFPDGASYRFTAMTLADGELVANAPPVATSFRIPLVFVQDGRRFGQYYPGYPALVALGSRVGAEWLVNALFGGALIAGTFWLGRRTYGEATGVLAAAIVATSTLLLSLTTTYLSHVCGSALFLLAVLAATSPGECRPWVRGIVAGALFGWGAAVRPYTAVLLAVPFGLWLLWRVRERPAYGFRLLGAFVLAALPWAGVILGWNRLLMGDWFASAYDIRWAHHALGFHEIRPHALFLPGEIVDHYSPRIAWIATSRQLVRLAETLSFHPSLGWGLLAVPLLGALRLGARGALLAAAPLVLIGGHFLYPGTMGISATQLGPRYYSEALPALAIVIAAPLAALVARLPAPRAVGTTVLALVLLGGAVLGVPAEAKRVAAFHADPTLGPNRELERFVDGLDDEPRLLLVDDATYHGTSALLVHGPDLSAPNLIALYREPDVNRELLDGFPGRSAHLVRWDRTRKEFVMTPYVPEEDTEGPRKRAPRGGRRQGDSKSSSR